MDFAIAVVFGLLLLLAFWAFFRKSWQVTESIKEVDLIPGWTRPPTHPQAGDLDLALSKGGLHLYLQQQHKGGSCPVVAFWWKNKRVVSVCGPKAFKDTESLWNRPRLIFATYEPLHGPKSIQSINDSEWEERKRIVHGALRGRNVEGCFDELVTIAEETAAMWGPGKMVYMMKEMFGMTSKGILATIFANIVDDGCCTEELVRLYDSCKCKLDTRVLNMLPPDNQQEACLQQNLKQLWDHMWQIMVSYKSQNAKRSAFLENLASSGLSKEIIVSDMITVFGGFHTVSFYLTWLFHYLAQHPTVQDKLLQDMTNRVNEKTSNESLKTYVLTSNSYLHQVLDEALRLSSTAANSAHYSNEDTVVDGYLIPAKTPIIQSIGVTLMDEAIWENPQSFAPDRFSPGSKAAKRGREFRPFGISNPRRCPANQFTYMMVSVFVTVLLKHFIFVSAQEEEPEKRYGIVVSPKADIQIQVKSRKGNVGLE